MGAPRHGGGIYNRGTVTVSNSTFSGNNAWTSGGGIYNDNEHDKREQQHLLRQ